MSRRYAFASAVAALALVTACAPKPLAPRASRGSEASPERTAEAVVASVDVPQPKAPPSAAPSVTVPTAPSPRGTAPRRAKARAVTSELAIGLISNRGETWGGETLHLSRCAAGTARSNAEGRIPLPATAFGVGLARGGDKIFAAAYLPFADEGEGDPASSLLYVLDERLRVVRQAPLGAPRNGDTVSSLSITADDRYLATYENDTATADTATLQLLAAHDLHVVAKTRVGASRATGNTLRHRLVMTEDDLYVLAPMFPARRERSSGDKVAHSAEEYVVTRLALPNLGVIAQRPVDIYELGDATMTLQNGRLSITDGERLATVSLDLEKHATITIPPRNAPPPPPKRQCGEGPSAP